MGRPRRTTCRRCGLPETPENQLRRGGRLNGVHEGCVGTHGGKRSEGPRGSQRHTAREQEDNGRAFPVPYSEYRDGWFYLGGGARRRAELIEEEDE